jgi:ADP-L-glycero-D-manno-heptose 6-epimerase
MKLAQQFPQVKIVGLRYCNIYGPRENHKGKSANMIYQLAQQMKKGNPRLFEFGEQKRDQIYVEDIVRANIAALDAKKSCVVNCGTGKAVNFNEIIKVLNDVTGLNRKIEYIANPYPFFQNHTECDMILAREMLGFEAKIGIEEGIKKYFDSGWLTKDPLRLIDNR